MSYTHCSIIERSQLEILYRLEWTNREIGEKLGRHHSAIAREKNAEARTEPTQQMLHKQLIGTSSIFQAKG